jgi:hypothetical protein
MLLRKPNYFGQPSFGLFFVRDFLMADLRFSLSLNA